MGSRDWGAPKNWGVPYEVKIARPDSVPITLEEWSRIVDADEDLHWSPDDDLEVEFDDGRSDRLPAVYWQSPSKCDTFLWCLGNVRTWIHPAPVSKRCWRSQVNLTLTSWATVEKDTVATGK